MRTLYKGMRSWFCTAVVLAIFMIAPIIPATAQTGSTGNGRILAGYWHDWETPVWIPLGQVPSTYDIIVVAFATYNGNGNFTFTVDPDETQAQFITDIKTLHSQGKKVLISLGGASETPTLSTASDAESMATSAVALINQFGFDGIDIDFENGAVYLNENDLNINAPTTPSVVYLISALQQFHAALPNAMVTMAPIANYAQAGYQYYGPGPYGDSNWNGAYLPVIQATSSFLSYVWPQYYNECNIEALDLNIYCEGTDGNLVGMSEMMMKGFPVAWSAGTFNGLNPDQVALGVPASTDASPGYLDNSDLQASFNYLITGLNQAGTYTLRNASGYPNTAGFMTWSINWDVYSNGGALGTGMHEYLATLSPINGNHSSFSLSATNASVTDGGTGTSTITESVSDGFDSTVTLAASGLPSGVTASFSPTSITGAGTSTLTLTASSTATAGTYTITVAGTPASGSTETTTFTLTVSSGTCTPTTIVPYISVNGGSSWTEESSATVSSTSDTTVDLGPQPTSGGSWAWSGPNGYTSTSRQISDIPLSVGSNVYTATYTNTSSCKSTQAFTITVTGGTAGFSLSATAASVKDGSTGTSTITESISDGFDSPVTLAASGLPSGVAASFSPTSITGAGTSTLTLTASSTATVGTYTITVTGTPASGSTETTTLTLTVTSTSSGSVTLSPSSYNFGSVTPDTGTAWVTFTLTNSGSSAVSISNVTVSGPFVVSSNCGSSIASDASCPVYVYFYPTAAGSFTGTLTVTDSASGSPQTSALSGTGS
jgi:chitinase